MTIFEKKNKMARSCKICGYFRSNQTTADDGTYNSGYCLFHDEEVEYTLLGKFLNRFGFNKFTGECVKISEGDERETAIKCRSYFRKVPDMNQNEFLSWRIGVEAYKNNRRFDIYSKMFLLLAIIIALLQLYK